jgi:hypothetical protein
VVTAILGGLPSTFKTIVVVLEAEDTTLTVDGIQPKLKSMEQNLQATKPPVDSLAMNAHVPGPRVSKYCRKTGHSAERCYMRDPESLKKFPPGAIATAMSGTVIQCLASPVLDQKARFSGDLMNDIIIPYSAWDEME